MNNHFQSSATTSTRRVGFPLDRRPRIELMGPDPNDTAQQDHGQRRDRPDNELHTALIRLVKAARRVRVGCAIPPGERQGSDDHGNDDDEHDRRRIDQEKSLRRRDRPLRIQYALTGREEEARADQDTRAYSLAHVRSRPRLCRDCWLKASRTARTDKEWGMGRGAERRADCVKVT